MTDPTSISVIIPTYNRAHLIGRAVTSALDQLEASDEVIVVDDGSSDDTRGAVTAFGDRVRYSRIENRGAGAARNHGVRQARNTLIAFLDSDDEWMPGKLEIHRRLFRGVPELLFAFTDFAITTRSGRVRRHFLSQWHKDSRSWDEILGPCRRLSSIAEPETHLGDVAVHFGHLYARMAFATYVCTSTVVVRRCEAGDALHFDEDLPMYEDWLCYARLARRGLGAYLDVETAWQHAHAGSRLTDASQLTSAETRLRILERLWGVDDCFLAEHGAKYKRLLEEQSRIRARSLIGLGRPREARQELRSLPGVPFHYRLLAATPAPLLRLLFKMRGLIGTRFGRASVFD